MKEFRGVLEFFTEGRVFQRKGVLVDFLKQMCLCVLMVSEKGIDNFPKSSDTTRHTHLPTMSDHRESEDWQRYLEVPFNTRGRLLGDLGVQTDQFRIELPLEAVSIRLKCEGFQQNFGKRGTFSAQRF